MRLREMGRWFPIEQVQTPQAILEAIQAGLPQRGQRFVVKEQEAESLLAQYRAWRANQKGEQIEETDQA